MIPRPMDQETQAAWSRTLAGQREDLDRALTRLGQAASAAVAAYERFAPFLRRRRKG